MKVEQRAAGWLRLAAFTSAESGRWWLDATGTSVLIPDPGVTHATDATNRGPNPADSIAWVGSSSGATWLDRIPVYRFRLAIMRTGSFFSILPVLAHTTGAALLALATTHRGQKPSGDGGASRVEARALTRLAQSSAA